MSSPRSTSARTRFEPMNPPPPVTRTFIKSSRAKRWDKPQPGKNAQHFSRRSRLGDHVVVGEDRPGPRFAQARGEPVEPRAGDVDPGDERPGKGTHAGALGEEPDERGNEHSDS